MCQRAYFSFNLMAKENQIKGLENDQNKRIDSMGSALDTTS